MAVWVAGRANGCAGEWHHSGSAVLSDAAAGCRGGAKLGDYLSADSAADDLLPLESDYGLPDAEADLADAGFRGGRHPDGGGVPREEPGIAYGGGGAVSERLLWAVGGFRLWWHDGSSADRTVEEDCRQLLSGRFAGVWGYRHLRIGHAGREDGAGAAWYCGRSADCGALAVGLGGS